MKRVLFGWQYPVLAFGVLNSIILGATPACAVAPAPEPKPPTVYSLVLIQYERPNLLGNVQAVSPGGESGFRMFRHFQSRVVKSQIVLTTALRDTDVAKLKLIKGQADPIGWLEENLTVDFPGDAGIMRLSLSGDRPDDLLLIVNAVTNAYLSEASRREIQDRTERLAQLQKHYEESREVAVSKQKTLREQAARFGVQYPWRGSIPQQVLAQDLVNLRKELRGVKVAQIALKSQLETQPGQRGEQETQKLREQLGTLTAQEKLLNDEVRRVEEQAKALEDKAAELEPLQKEVSQAEAAAERIRTVIESLKAELNAAPSARLLQGATESRIN